MLNKIFIKDVIADQFSFMENISDDSESSDHSNKFYNLFNKFGFMSSLYAILGVILIILFFNIFNIYILHLKIESAVISMPIERIVSPLAGFISDIYVQEGQSVKKGMPLANVNNFEVEKDLQLEMIQLDEAKLAINYLQNLLVNEQQRLNFYKTVGSNRLVSAQANADITKEEVQILKNNLGRLEILHKKKYITDAELETAKSNYVNAEKKMKSALAQKDIENESLNAVNNGLYFTGDKLEGIMSDLNAQLISAKGKLKLSEEKVAVYKNMQAKLKIVAPFDGRVTGVLKSSGNSTDNASPILLLENMQVPMQIIAYLTQNEILHIGTQRKVKIYIPAINKIYMGHIVSIDRTTGFVDEEKAQYRWRDVDLDRSAKVSIEIDSHDEKPFYRSVIAGMPAIVYFARKFNLL